MYVHSQIILTKARKQMLKAVKELFPSIEPEHSIVFTQRGALGSRAWKYKRELKENVSRELSGLY